MYIMPRVSLFRCLGGQLRGSGANWRKNSGHIVVLSSQKFFVFYLYIVIFLYMGNAEVFERFCWEPCLSAYLNSFVLVYCTTQCLKCFSQKLRVPQVLTLGLWNKYFCRSHPLKKSSVVSPESGTGSAGSAYFWASWIRIRLQILPLSHKCLEWTEIMLDKIHF